MRLHIVVGFPDTSSVSQPSLVYLGRSGEDMRQAIERSTSQRHLILSNPVGISKNNPLAAANIAAEAEAKSAAKAAEAEAKGKKK